VANRSYLYATDVPPGGGDDGQDRELVGISEWNYDVPIVFKLLLSGSPKTCRSAVWDMDEEIALAGDYDAGVANLEAFLARITLPEAQPLIEEARAFLHDPAHRRRYFLLECGELYDMDEDPFEEQNAALLADVLDLDEDIEAALAGLAPVPQTQPGSLRSRLDRLLGRTPEPPPPSARDPLLPVRLLGLGNWSTILYYDFGADEDEESEENEEHGDDGR